VSGVLQVRVSTCTYCAYADEGARSQVHDLHPSHAFFVVPDLQVQSNDDSEFFETVPPDIGPEGEKCTQRLFIVSTQLHSFSFRSINTSRRQMRAVSILLLGPCL
jgi:hypothetical protein